VVEAQPGSLARWPVMQEHVGLFHRVQHRAPASGVPEVSLHQSLAAVERQKARRTVSGHRRHPPQDVPSGRLNTDHFSSEHPQQVTGQRCLDSPPGLDHHHRSRGYHQTRGQDIPAPPRARLARRSRVRRTVCNDRFPHFPRVGCAAVARPPRRWLRHRPTRRTSGPGSPRATERAAALPPSHSAARTAATPGRPPFRAPPGWSTALATARDRGSPARRSPHPRNETAEAARDPRELAAPAHPRCPPPGTETRSAAPLPPSTRRRPAVRRRAAEPADRPAHLGREPPSCRGDVVHSKAGGPTTASPAVHGHQPARRLRQRLVEHAAARTPTIHPAHQRPPDNSRPLSTHPHHSGQPRQSGLHRQDVHAKSARALGSLPRCGSPTPHPRRLAEPYLPR